MARFLIRGAIDADNEQALRRQLATIGMVDVVTQDDACDRRRRYVQAAKGMHKNDEACDIDGDAIVSFGDDAGAYVMAWLWVDADDAADDDGGDDRKAVR